MSCFQNLQMVGKIDSGIMVQDLVSQSEKQSLRKLTAKRWLRMLPESMKVVGDILETRGSLRCPRGKESKYKA